MTGDVTAQPLFDGTFSTEAQVSAGHALVDQLHDEAMATIAALAENWDKPVSDDPADAPAVEDDDPVTFQDPATWSVQDDEDDEVRLLQPFELPALLPRPRQAAANAAGPIEAPAEEPVHDPVALASADTDEIAVPVETAGQDRTLAAA